MSEIDSLYAQQRSERVIRYPKRIEVHLVYDGYGKVIYVGRTDNWERRYYNHRNKKAPWLLEARRIEHLYFDTYGDSLVAEATFIRDHSPRFNVAGVSR